MTTKVLIAANKLGGSVEVTYLDQSV
jgi:hypothetical protein